MGTKPVMGIAASGSFTGSDSFMTPSSHTRPAAAFKQAGGAKSERLRGAARRLFSGRVALDQIEIEAGLCIGGLEPEGLLQRLAGTREIAGMRESDAES